MLDIMLRFGSGKHFDFFGGWGKAIQDLFLVLFSDITKGRLWEPCGARGDQLWVIYVPGKCLSHCAISMDHQFDPYKTFFITLFPFKFVLLNFH